MRRTVLVSVSLLVSACLGRAMAHPAPSEAVPPSTPDGGAVVPASGGEIIRQTPRGTEIIKITPEMSAQLGLATTQLKAPGMKITPHIHDHDDEAFFVHRGGGLFILGDRTVPISEGDTVFIPKGVAHGFENTSHDTLLVWAISSSRYLELHRMFFSEAPKPSPAEVEQLYRKYGFRDVSLPP